MLLALTVLTGVVLVAALAAALLARAGRPVVVEAEGRRAGPLPLVLQRRIPMLSASAPEPALAPGGTFSGLTKTEAEELLDWLEGNGFSGCELSYEEGTGFTVRCP